MKILVTGFEPFGGDPENASAEAVRLLAEAWAAEPQHGVELVTGTLPVAFAGAGPALTALVERHAPDAVLAVGEAGGRSAITPERWSVNEVDARIPDNDGAQPRGTVIDPDGPARRASAFDADALASAVLSVGLPADASDDAGRFVCNHVAYLVGGLRVAGRAVPGGFVHVPAVRSRGRATVGAETDPAMEPAVGATATEARSRPDASAVTHDGEALTFDDLALGLAAMVRAIADGQANRASTREQGRIDSAATVIGAAPAAVYEALLDPVALAAWLPPEGTSGTIEQMEAREGGGFRLVLRFADPVDTKTDAATDAARVTFVELVRDELVVQRVAFESAEERFQGEMVMTWRFEPVEAGTRVSVMATDVPPGISQADHELGIGQALANLSRHLTA